MRVYTDGAVSVSDGQVGPALVLLRRIGVVVGLLFGLGLIAMVMAHRAAAEEHVSGSPASTDTTAGQDAGPASINNVVGRLTEPVTKPVAESITKPVIKPVTEQVIAPVVQVAADAVAPVTRPVVDAVAPVTAPVLRPVLAAVAPVVQPVAELVAPVTEPLVGPLVDAAAPVVAPVAAATGLGDVADAVSGDGSRQDTMVTAGVPPAAVASTVVTPVSTPDSMSAAPARVSTAPAVGNSGVRSGARMATSSPGPQPGLPSAPSQPAATGGGSFGGASGAHSVDALPQSMYRVLRGEDVAGRGPPGTLIGNAWFAYDDRDHPS